MVFSKRDLKYAQRCLFVCLFLGEESSCLQCLEVSSTSEVEKTNKEPVDFKSKGKSV